MTTCPRCASELRSEWKFCVMCGERRADGVRTGGVPINQTNAIVLIAAASTGAVIIAGVVALAVALL